ncbi:MAG TPA: polyphosphate kinase 2 family protein [Galbitalea sp.]|jgi:PPK2 family polyphosphate:nucleotide phosphotransferase|nr:polyphosphate kinase 2 family protein [Galbitalea sp.]
MGIESKLRATPDTKLADIDTASSPGFKGDKDDADKVLAAGVAEIGDLQERLFAESLYGGKRSVLLVLQAMDTAGKGGTVEHVLEGVDPHGIKIHSFKAPTPEEKAHDFLWRITPELPPAGFLGVFDRSHYEDVLIAKVHQLAPPAEIERRYDAISEFEAGIVANGTTVIKVMLHVSPDEQKKRLLARLDDPTKQWKFNPEDVDERGFWNQYQEAYQIAIDRTTTDAAPWYVVPADHKWYSRLAVQDILLTHLRELDPQWPDPTYDVAAQRARVETSTI